LVVDFNQGDLFERDTAYNTLLHQEKKIAVVQPSLKRFNKKVD
jgi:hypothetical protein